MLTFSGIRHVPRSLATRALSLILIFVTFFSLLQMGSSVRAGKVSSVTCQTVSIEDVHFLTHELELSNYAEGAEALSFSSHYSFFYKHFGSYFFSTSTRILHTLIAPLRNSQHLQILQQGLSIPVVLRRLRI